MNTEPHFSSQSNEWRTPRYLFDYLNQLVQFDLDPCANADNALCDNYFTVEQDGLAQSWAGKKVLMNPPYGREIGKWVKKAYEEGKTNNAEVFCLLPARTDTKWFWDYCRFGEIYFLKGRVKFIGAGKSGAPFPSMIVVFSRRPLDIVRQADMFAFDHASMKSTIERTAAND